MQGGLRTGDTIPRWVVASSAVMIVAVLTRSAGAEAPAPAEAGTERDAASVERAPQPGDAADADVPVASDGADALPDLVRVGVAGPLDPGLTLSALVGYGYTGAVIASSDSHQRAAVNVAGSVRLLPWLAVSARFSGRYDRHTAPPNGTDAGWVGDPRAAIRAVTGLGGGLWLGAQVGVWLPGGDAPSIDPSAATVSARGLASWQVNHDLVLSGQLGYRLDRSARSAPDADLLSASDRLALGVSQFNAALVGAGASLAVSRRVAIAGEWSWDRMLGSGAPRGRSSPMRVGAAVRVALAPGLDGQILGQVSLSRSPDLGAMAPLYPVEPRLLVMAGVTVHLFDSRSTRARAAGEHGADTGATGAGEHRGDAGASSAAPDTGSVEVAVSGPDGTPVEGAEVTLTQGQAAPRQAWTDAAGQARFDDVPVGQAHLAIRHAGDRDADLTVEVGANAAATGRVELEHALPPGQLRGVVRSFRGRPVAAQLTLAPLGLTVTCDAHGEFQLDVPPGSYQVSIAAPGFARQTRRVKIEQNGVTILNVDLRK